MTRRVKAVLAAAFLVTALQVAPAAGMPQSEPNGPWEIPNQHESLSAIRDYPQLIATLESIVGSSKGAATLTYSPFRAKGSGRAIPIVTIGDGPRGMMIIANQHGDEYVVSNSAVEIVRALTRNSAWARSVRDELTVTIMPRVNIDGFDANPRGTPWRENVDPNVCPAPTPCPAFYTRGRGYDINRYHSYLVSDPRDDPNTGPVGTGQGDNPVPEALAARAAYDAAGGPQVVEVAMDLHHQGTPLDANGDMVTGSTLWPNATSTADALGIRPQFDGVIFRSKQVVATLVEAVHQYGYGTFRATRERPRRGSHATRTGCSDRRPSSWSSRRRPKGERLPGEDRLRRRHVGCGVSGESEPVLNKDVAPAEALVLAPSNASLFGKCLAPREYTLENYNFCREKLGLNPVSTLPPQGEATPDSDEATTIGDEQVAWSTE